MSKNQLTAMALIGVTGFICAACVVMLTAKSASAQTQTTTVSFNNATIDVNGKTVAASAIASGKVTILSFVMAHGVSKKQVAKAKARGMCMKIGKGTKVPGYWNTGMPLHWFWDTRRAEACKIHGVWRKVGPVNCGNLLRFKAPKSHIVTGKVILVRSTLRLKVLLQAAVSVYVQDTCGHAQASVEASARINLNIFLKAHGNVTAKMFGKSVVNFVENVQASVACPNTTTGTTVNTTTTTTTTTQTTTTTTTTVPTTTTTPPPSQLHFSCTGFEEISGGGSFLVDCKAVSDNGAEIFLDTSSSANVNVSGINCLTNGGGQSCPSGGTFEFRATGVNDTNSIETGSITVTVSASGNKDASQTYTFPVDPSGGGFLRQHRMLAQ